VGDCSFIYFAANGVIIMLLSIVAKMTGAVISIKFQTTEQVRHSGRLRLHGHLDWMLIASKFVDDYLPKLLCKIEDTWRLRQR
jgi:hypothetical protein